MTDSKVKYRVLAVYMGNPGDYSTWDAGTTLNLGSLDGGAAWNKVGSGSITNATPP